jgi:putative membrane-bound dehydrogenase-like protein
LLLATSATGADRPAIKTHQVRLNGHTFTLPEGFEIELVAGPPLVDRPISADFDEQGRLYVTDSSGSNEKVEEQLKKKPHRVVRLEDTKGTGRFDKATTFADKMMFPEGAKWFKGSLYVAAPPSIWKLTDTKGNGVADQRVEWFEGKTLGHCANDLHGPYLGPDGWIYWCKGAFAQQTYELSDKRRFVTKASHIFRCRPDGTGIEPVLNGGMDNPVGVAFLPSGERFLTATFVQHPAGGKRDGLMHAVYGGLYGKDHAPIYDHKWTGPDLMPIMTHYGAAAPCGVTCYQSRVFGPEYQDNLFACLFNLRKVTRHVLQPSGATFKSRDEDFLVSDNLDFHPTDVLEDADGSLLVVDTGGWYKLCCPTSQLVKPDVLGAIYRIRRKGAPRIDDPRGLKLKWADLSLVALTDLLDDDRPAVRRRAIESLGDKKVDVVPVLRDVLKSAKSVRKRRNAVWVAARLDETVGCQIEMVALRDEDESVRQAAIHSVSTHRNHFALGIVRELLKGPSLHNRRVAAEALGRLGGESAVADLLKAAGEPNDRVLEHSLVYALIEIGNREKTAVGLDSDNPRIRRAALIALDQMDDGKLKVETVARELNANDAALKEAAWWIAGRHPEWGEALAGFLRERLLAKGLTESEHEELVGRLARFAGAASVQDLLAAFLRDSVAQRESRRTALRAMARASLKESPEKWITSLMDVLGGKDADLLREAVLTAQAMRVSKKQTPPFADALLAVGKNPKTPTQTRLNALAGLPGGLAKTDPALFTFLRDHLNSEEPVAVRSVAASVLARAKLGSDELLSLADSLKAAGPMELDRLLEAFAQSSDEKVGKKLLASLKTATSRSVLRIESVKTRLTKYPAAIQKEAEELYALLNVDADRQKAKLEDLLASLKDGDVRRGQAVFNSSKAACASCHAIGYRGGNVGPDLTHIGKLRSERDLLESIVFPSASIVRSYEPVRLTTKSGKEYNGLIRKDTPDEIVLRLNATEEVRIARKDIDDMEPSKVSIMPAGLDQQLTRRELADLVAFLRACK